MKTSEAEAIVLAIIAVSALSSAVLTGYQNRDITEDRTFGCTWLGGSSSGTVKCNCRDDAEEMYISENSIPTFDTTAIEISNCKAVRFGANAVANMRNLRNIHLNNIQLLNFEKSSLKWYGYRDLTQYEERYDFSIPSVMVKIENSHISSISSYTFEGRINTIHLEGVIVDNLEAFAFNSLMQTKNIIVKNCQLNNIKPQSFKKFSTENIELDGLRAELVPSRFLSNITVYENFAIKNCFFDTVRPGAFMIYGPKTLEISESRINHLDGEAFKVVTRGDVLFKNNSFDVINDGAFAGISVNTDEVFSDLTMTFDSNTFTELSRDSLTLDKGFHAKFSNMRINTTCDCKTIDNKIRDVAFYNEINCLHRDEFVTVKEFKANMCSIMKSYSTVIIIVGVILLLCFIIVTVLFVYYRRVYLSRKYGKGSDAKKGNMSLIVPDGRTYRETELHVIVERADLLTTDL